LVLQEIPKTQAERIDELLSPLMPLLKSCMDSKEIPKIAKEMTVTDYFSSGMLQWLLFLAI